MDGQLIGLLVILAIAAIAAVIGVGFGIVVIAPRLRRALDRQDTDEEEPGDRPD